GDIVRAGNDFGRNAIKYLNACAVRGKGGRIERDRQQTAFGRIHQVPALKGTRSTATVENAALRAGPKRHRHDVCSSLPIDGKTHPLAAGQAFRIQIPPRLRIRGPRHKLRSTAQCRHTPHTAFWPGAKDNLIVDAPTRAIRTTSFADDLRRTSTNR